VSVSLKQGWDPLAFLTGEQVDKLAAYEALMFEANERVNLVSRASIASFRERHLIHSLAIGIRSFPEGSTVVDWGSGGGLPGIPLAVQFPAVQFVLVDSIRKKTDHVAAIIRELDLKNVRVDRTRAEVWPGRCDFAVSRATAPLSRLWAWTKRASRSQRSNVAKSDAITEPGIGWLPGLIALKGGNLEAEIEEARRRHAELVIESIPLEPLLGANYADKYVIALS